jgi:hypothetical protein
MVEQLGQRLPLALREDGLLRKRASNFTERAISSRFGFALICSLVSTSSFSINFNSKPGMSLAEIEVRIGADPLGFGDHLPRLFPQPIGLVVMPDFLHDRALFTLCRPSYL